MGITRQNALYNDPQLAKAFDNVAKMFAPPSGADVYGYTHARLLRDQLDARSRIRAGNSTAQDWALAGVSDPSKNYALADMYRRSLAPGVTPESLDTSAYAINGNANNTFEGQRRALSSAERQKAMQTTTDIITQSMTPVSKDAVRVIPPAALPALGYGSPASSTTLADAWSDVPLPPAGDMPQSSQDDLVSAIMRSNTAGAVSPELGAALGGLTPAIAPQVPPRTSVDGVGQVEQGSSGPAITGPRAAGAAPLTQYGMISVQPGETVIRPDGAIFRGQPKPEAQPEIQKLIAARDALAPNDPNRKLYDDRINALNQGNFQGAYERQNDEALAKERETIAAGSQSALADRDSYRVMMAAVNNPNVDQGTLGRARLTLNKALNAFGFDGGDTSPAEMLDALGKQIALRLRNPNGGAGMPGAMSDSDRQFLQSMSLSLGNSPQANRMLGQFYLAAGQRAADLEQLAQNYEAQHGRLDNGWRAVKSKYLTEADPTAPLRSQMAGGASPAQVETEQAQQPVRVSTPEEASQLPSGTVFVAPDGKMRRAP